MTRLRTVLATAPILACAAIAMPAEAASAHGARWGLHAGRVTPATHSRSKKHSRAHGRRSSNRRGVAHKSRVPRTVSTPRNTAVLDASRLKAVTIARVLATPCQNAQLIPETSNLPLIRAAVLCLINTERAQHDESPLTISEQLEQAAEGHSQEMIALDYFDHVSPSGLTPVDRVRNTGYIPNSQVGYVIGENLAWGTLTLATPQAIVSAWLASPGHLANILEGKYRETGIGVMPEAPAELSEGAPGALYTQEFGVVVG